MSVPENNPANEPPPSNTTTKLASSEVSGSVRKDPSRTKRGPSPRERSRNKYKDDHDRSSEKRRRDRSGSESRGHGGQRRDRIDSPGR
jgi:hypothetical protein